MGGLQCLLHILRIVCAAYVRTHMCVSVNVCEKCTIQGGENVAYRHFNLRTEQPMRSIYG